MYLQEILEVAVGLVFMWLVISVAAMSIQEWIANLLKWRSKDLQGAIRKMLADPDIAKEFYNHQLIRGLSKDANWFQKTWNAVLNFFRRLLKQQERKFDNRPSYIPRGDFALTLFDLVMKAGTEASPIQNAFKQVNNALDSLKEDQINFESKEDARKALQTLLEMARDVAVSDIGQEAVDSVKLQVQKFAADYPQLQSALEQAMPHVDEYYRRLLEEKRNAPPADAAAQQDKTLQRLRLGLVAIGMNNPKLQESLHSLLTGAEGYIKEKETALLVARTNVETWFDNSMARLSGWYKRKAQLTAFLIGLVLALALNVDSIVLATSLWREPTLRQAIVAQAQAYARQNETLPQTNGGTPPQKTVADLQAEFSALKIPFGWETETYFIQAGETCQIVPLSQNAVWGMWSSGGTCKRVSNAPVDSTGWLSKIAGVLITALAAAQGAPFWFDVLKKLVNVRSSGPNPSETPAKG